MRVLVVALLIPLAGFAQEWEQLPDFPGTARDDAASFSLEGKVYVGTGMEVGWVLTNDWFAFNTFSDTWDTIASLPGSARQYCSTFVLNGFGYLFGGVDSNGPLTELWRYDPGADAWDQLTSLPAAPRYASTAFAYGGYGYICTGMLDGGIATSEVWRYDPVGDGWLSRAPVPGPARHRAAGADNVVIGGADAAFTALADGYAYNVTLNSWSPMPDLPGSRFGARSSLGLVVGGASDQTTFHDDAWMHSYLENDWTSWTVPAFSGGPRRSGVIGIATDIADVGIWYYGTGSDNTQRYRDWWRLIVVTGIEELRTDPLQLMPNPATRELHISFNEPGQKPYGILDELGRSVITGSVTTGDVIDVSLLTAGQYTLHVLGDRPLRASFIKLP